MSLSDTCAAWIGKRWGRFKIGQSHKTGEGFLGFLLGGMGVWILSTQGFYLSLEPILFLVALVSAALIELVECLEDNCSVVLCYCCVYWILDVCR